MVAKKIPLNKILSAIDKKDRGFYDRLTDEERKQFSAFLMLKYCAAVQGKPEMEEWYLRATNEYVNKHFWDLTKHPKLQWLLMTVTSPGMGTHYHKWIKQMKKEKSNLKTIEFLRTIYTTAKDYELETLANRYSSSDIKKLAEEQGYDRERIKAEL